MESDLIKRSGHYELYEEYEVNHKQSHYNLLKQSSTVYERSLIIVLSRAIIAFITLCNKVMIAVY